LTWFNSPKVGSYDIMCAEYCGLNHSHMYSKVVVLPIQNFNYWLNNMAKLKSVQEKSPELKSHYRIQQRLLNRLKTKTKISLKQLLNILSELTKIRITSFVTITTAFGYICFTENSMQR